MLLLTAGVMLAVWEGTATGTWEAILLCLTGTVCNAAMMSTTGKLLSERIDVLRLTFYTAPVSSACLAPLFFVREVSSLCEFVVADLVISCITCLEAHSLCCLVWSRLPA